MGGWGILAFCVMAALCAAPLVYVLVMYAREIELYRQDLEDWRRDLEREERGE
jgi:hypothetical protein